MRASQPGQVGCDLERIREILHQTDLPFQELCRTDVWRPVCDVGIDWFIVLLSALAVRWLGPALVPIAVLITGNRQRALGNLLHDAGHRNLVREGQLNDLLAEIFLSSSLFNSLTVYRDSHARHHAWLGDPRRDPDYIVPTQAHASSWWTTYLRILCTTSAWSGSAFGHLLIRGIPPSLKFRIVLWWLCALALLSTLVDWRFALLFFGIWLSAKATAFHAITTFREMCDHFGLRPGGIFSFTRDISTTSPWCWILHPRHNGYHLTHHLMPAVPYYRLRRTHELLSQLPVYENRATCCDTYFRGRGAVVRSWAAGTASCSIEA